MKKILIIVPDGGMLFESAGIADILMQANRLHPEGAREICYQVKLATTQPHQVIHGQSGLNLLADHRLHEIDPRILPYSAAFTCMKGMTVIVLMWEEAAIKDDVIEYDIAFNIIYIMRTHVVVANLRCPSLTK